MRNASYYSLNNDRWRSLMPESWKQWEGQVVDRSFPLFQYLGGSEHSAVFLTEGRGQKVEPLAIKLLATDPNQSAAQLARWTQAARLSHPHLIRLFQYGRFDMMGTALLYLVMEYVEENLSQVLPQRALTKTEAEEMLAPLLEALEFLHGRGFVHGHLQPSNIMAMGTVLKLTSDSLSLSGESSTTNDGIYRAPEAIQGTLSPASDVWSLGVTLVEAFTQRRPNFSPTLAEPAVAESIPPPFREIARQCLARDPRQRPSLSTIHRQLNAMREAPKEQTAAPTGPIWRYLVPVLAVVIILALFIVFSVRSNRPKSSMPVPSPQAKPEAKPHPAEPQRQAATANSGSSSTLSRPSGGEKAEPGRSAPGVIHQVLPHVSPRASDTIQGTIRVAVRLDVDTSGNVTLVQFESRGPSAYFARLAMEAAQQWKFTPAQSNGQNLPTQWILRFQFRKKGTTVAPFQLAP